jgi:hypothetical protein
MRILGLDQAEPWTARTSNLHLKAITAAQKLDLIQVKSRTETAQRADSTTPRPQRYSSTTLTTLEVQLNNVEDLGSRPCNAWTARTSKRALESQHSSAQDRHKTSQKQQGDSSASRQNLIKAERYSSTILRTFSLDHARHGQREQANLHLRASTAAQRQSSNEAQADRTLHRPQRHSSTTLRT